MAFIKGTAVDPRLGALDFSGFTRAAEIQASALADLGDKIGKGMKQYSLNKQELGQNIAKIEAYTQEDSNILADFETKTADELPTGVFKAYQDFKKGDTTLPNSRILLSHIENRIEAQQSQLEQQQTLAAIAELEQNARDDEDRQAYQAIVRGNIALQKNEFKGDPSEFVPNMDKARDLANLRSYQSGVSLGIIDEMNALMDKPEIRELAKRQSEAETRSAEIDAAIKARTAKQVVDLSQQQVDEGQLDIDIKEQQLEAAKRENEKQEALLAQSLVTGGEFLQDSALFEAADKEAGKTLNEDIRNLTTSEQTIREAEDIIKALDSEDVKTRTFTAKTFGALPQAGPFFKKIFNPKTEDLVDRIRGIAFKTLRETLGAQFTEREGQRLVDTYFNDMLDNTMNINRLSNFIRNMKEIQATRRKYLDYVDKKGTIRGYYTSIKGDMDALALVNSMFKKAEDENTQMNISNEPTERGMALAKAIAEQKTTGITITARGE